MRVGIDISSVTPSRTGIGTYTCELVRKMVHSTDHEFVLFFNSLRQPLPEFTEMHRTNVTVRHYRVPGPVLLRSWQWVDLPDIRTLVDDVDVFHAPATYIPPQRVGKRAVTIHDLSFMDPTIPQDSLGGKYLKWVCERRLGEMDLILVNSPSTRRAVSEFLEERNQTGPKIEMSPLGVDARFFVRADETERRVARERFNLPERFILSVGTQEPRKNFPHLIAQYAEVHLRNKAVPPLVIAGNAGWRDESLRETARHCRVEDRVLFPGYIQLDVMPAVFQQASAFVLPSLMEGFGLPVLEAMAARIPVVCSATVGVLELLGGNLVDTFSTSDEGSLAVAIVDALASAENHSRLERAYRAAETFTWQRCADITLAAYENLARGESASG